MNSQLFYKVMSGYYDLLDVIYFRKPETSPRKLVLDSVVDGDKVLDLCTGTATNAVAIAKKYPNAKVVGIDLSKDMLIIAKSKVKKENLDNVSLYRMDATALKFKDETFDKVLLSLVLHEMDDELAASIIKEAMRVLKPDGELVVTEWEREISPVRKLIFSPIDVLEPKPYKSFIKKDLVEYFKEYGLETIRKNHCDYSTVINLKKNMAFEIAGEADNRYLKRTKMLDYDNAAIVSLINDRGWKDLSAFDCIKSVYNYIRDEILFGYNVDDSIPASKVLKDGYGQCNTKGTLFMAILRACGIPCRVHGFTIDKELQKGAMTGIVYKNAPRNVFHSWVEVLFEGTWYELEAFIIDKSYLTKLQKINSDCTGAFCGYGVAVTDFMNPTIDFDRNNTYIQSEGINQDFGVYDSPDDLLKEHGQEISKLKAFAYRNLGRHLMNINVKKVRNTIIG